jgi:hypothetical protein
VSFRECLSEAARHYGFPTVSKFLDEVKLIRWSSTITSNVLGERRGAKVGLLVSKGHEQDRPVFQAMLENAVRICENSTKPLVLRGPFCDTANPPAQLPKRVTCGRRHGKNFLTLLQDWSGAVTCPAC